MVKQCVCGGSPDPAQPCVCGGKSLQQLADETGWSKTTIFNRLRAKAKLEKKVDENDPTNHINRVLRNWKRP